MKHVFRRLNLHFKPILQIDDYSIELLVSFYFFAVSCFLKISFHFVLTIFFSPNLKSKINVFEFLANEQVIVASDPLPCLDDESEAND